MDVVPTCRCCFVPLIGDETYYCAACLADLRYYDAVERERAREYDACPDDEEPYEYL